MSMVDLASTTLTCWILSVECDPLKIEKAFESLFPPLVVDATCNGFTDQLVKTDWLDSLAEQSGAVDSPRNARCEDTGPCRRESC